MRPVVLSIAEGKKFLLGTFDTTNFQNWWKSEPFPGQIDEIQQPLHVFGQYHVCIVKMHNGTYSIYRTKNMGKSWEQVYNTPDKIYTLNLIDYGWVIGSTSSGWIESKLDSGYSWLEISTFAPGCQTVINISDDVLFAHDGTSVWRSYDFARSWSKVITKTGWTSKGYHVPSITQSFKWSGWAYPALAGIGQTILVGFGPYLNISEDLGETWFTHLQGWNSSWAYYNSPTSGWGGSQLFSPLYNTRILQLIMTDTSGTTLNETAIMARVLKLDTNQVMYAYSGQEYSFENKTTSFAWKTIFTLPFANLDSGVISSYDVLRPGSSEKDKLAVVCSYDSNNRPIVKYSIDAGWIWSTLNYNNVTVYEGDPTQEIISGKGQQIWDEEYWTKSTWVGAACHNSGKYITEYNKTVRCISSDQDLLVSFRKTKNSVRDILIKEMKTKNLLVDLLSKKTKTKDGLFDILNKKNMSKNYLVSQLLQDTFEKTFEEDVVLASRNLFNCPIQLPLLKSVPISIYYDTLLFDSVDKLYSATIELIDNHVKEILTTVAKYTPQAPDIRYDDIPYVPYDSRTQEVVP
jgi:hypothetical protein